MIEQAKARLTQRRMLANLLPTRGGCGGKGGVGSVFDQCDWEDIFGVVRLFLSRIVTVYSIDIHFQEVPSYKQLVGNRAKLFADYHFKNLDTDQIFYLFTRRYYPSHQKFYDLLAALKEATDATVFEDKARCLMPADVIAAIKEPELPKFGLHTRLVLSREEQKVMDDRHLCLLREILRLRLE